MNPAPERYVYYRLKPEQAEAARAAFDAARAGAAVRLLQRADTEAGLLTWMEIYGPDVEQAAELEPRIAAALAGLIEEPRHVEHFLALTGA